MRLSVVTLNSLLVGRGERLVDFLVHLAQRFEKLVGARLLLELCLVDRAHVLNVGASQGHGERVSWSHARVDGNGSPFTQ